MICQTWVQIFAVIFRRIEPVTSILAEEELKLTANSPVDKLTGLRIIQCDLG